MDNLEKANFYSTRIIHFIKGYRQRKTLTQTDLAKKIGSTKSTVSRIENDQDKQIANILIILNNLANLESMSLSQFFKYIENEEQDNASELFPWQKIVLEKLQTVKQSVRLELICSVFNELSDEKFEEMINLLNSLSKLSPGQLECVQKVTSEFLDK